MDKKLQETLADVFGIKAADITPDLRKDDVETWDSLKQMDLVISLEKAYDISLDITDIVGMVSVQAIMDALERKGVSLEN